MKLAPLASGLAALLLAPTAAAYYLGGLREVPVERILPRLEQRAQDRPREAHSQYLLGRVHGAAFGRRAESIRAGQRHTWPVR